MPDNTPPEELRNLYQKKQKILLKHFDNCKNSEQTYEKIIELGKKNPQTRSDIKKEHFLVEGCQSLVYLSSEISKENTIQYYLLSDALISSGLAALLFSIYNNESPELILHCPPLFIQELGLNKSLSPGRSNGLAGMYVRMKKDAITFFIEKTRKNSI